MGKVMKGTYETMAWEGPAITQVDAGQGRKFLVLQARAPHPSIILFWDADIQSWVSIGSTSADGDPANLVTGVLMRRAFAVNLLEVLKRDLKIQRAMNASLMNQVKRSVRQKVRLGSGERGRRGGRNP